VSGFQNAGPFTNSRSLAKGVPPILAEARFTQHSTDDRLLLLTVGRERRIRDVCTD
jgi:hypothetical protein